MPMNLGHCGGDGLPDSVRTSVSYGVLLVLKNPGTATGATAGTWNGFTQLSNIAFSGATTRTLADGEGIFGRTSDYYYKILTVESV